MQNSDEWAGSLREICYPVEKYLLGYPDRDKELLAGAIISSAFLNGTQDFERLKKDAPAKSLETIGEYVLGFAFLEHFPHKENATPDQIDDFREFHGQHATLHWYAKNHLHLQNFILWGTEEKTTQAWDQPASWILADRLEMLIGVVYLEKGIGAVGPFLEKHNFYPAIDTFRKTG